MKKNHITLCLRIVLLSCFLSGTESGRAACTDTFTEQEEQTLSLAIKAEELLQTVYSQSYETNERISKLLRPITDIVNTWETIRQPLSFHKLRTLERSIDRLSEAIRDLQRTQEQAPVYKETPQEPLQDALKDTLPEWANLIEDPSLIKPNTPYQVKWPNGQEASIVFSKQIVETFFSQSNAPLDTNTLQIARKNLSTISLGYTNGDTSGIRILRRSSKKSGQSSHKYNQLFEIKTLGKIAGHIRIGGFIHEGVFYVVHYIKGADHGTTRVPFISTLLQKQSRFVDYQEI